MLLGLVLHLFLVPFLVEGTHLLEHRLHTLIFHNYFLVDTDVAVDILVVLWVFSSEIDCDHSQIHDGLTILSVQDCAIDFYCDLLPSPQYLVRPHFCGAVDGDVGHYRRDDGESSCDVYALNVGDLAIDSAVYGGHYLSEGNDFSLLTSYYCQARASKVGRLIVEGTMGEVCEVAILHT